MSPPRIPVKDRLLARRRIVGECWIYTGSTHADGYGVIGVGRHHQLRAHRAAYMEFIGAIPHGLLVCHSCDIPLCINPAHLFLGTHKENSQDMLSKGRHHTLRGELHPMAKLSDDDVAEIRAMRHRGELLAAIGRKFGVSFQHISLLAKGNSRVG